jgi:RNA polymerase primary sigma factor
LGGKLTVEKIQELRFLTQGITSTNTVVGDDEDTELQEFLWDEDTETPEDYAMTIGSVESIEELLNQLTPQEKKIIVSRYGLDDGEQLTLEEIGIEMGLTRERIRQLERGAINKMRIYSRDNDLDLF